MRQAPFSNQKMGLTQTWRRLVLSAIETVLKTASEYSRLSLFLDAWDGGGARRNGCISRLSVETRGPSTQCYVLYFTLVQQGKVFMKFYTGSEAADNRESEIDIAFLKMVKERLSANDWVSIRFQFCFSLWDPSYWS